jgi:hypothetical protein
LQPVVETGDELVPALREDHQLIRLIEDPKAILKVDTPKLAQFFVLADKVVKRIVELNGLVRAELLEHRREQGDICGDQNQHRRFIVPGVGTLTIETRLGFALIPDKAEALLRSKGLYDNSVDVSVVGDTRAFYRIIRGMRKELKAAGIDLQESLSYDKLDALCKLGLITPAELTSVLQEKAPQYAVKAKAAK